ncbi:MAG: hypothetical protein HY098_01650 [Nitrospinae bacterium]|nr:hypothetical protein [Nitrospinota bacterium]
MLPNLIVLAAFLALKRLPYAPFLYSSGTAAILFGVRLVAERSPTGAAMRRFSLAVSFFVLVVVWRGHPGISSAVAAGWAFRGLAGRRSFLVESPVKSFLLELFFSSLVFAWTAGMVLPDAFVRGIPVVLLLLIFSRGISARLQSGRTDMAGEAVTAVLAAAPWGMDASNLIFALNPVHTALIAAILGYVLNGAGVLGKLSAFIFFLSGGIIFTFAGREAFLFFFMFALILTASERFWPGQRVDSLFNLFSILAAAASVYSIGREDPFPAFLAVSGLFSAGAFYAWSGMGSVGGLKGFTGGAAGAALVSSSAWLSSFLPHRSVPLVFVAGGFAMLAPSCSVLLENPEEGHKWALAALGAFSAVFLFRLTLIFGYG